MITRGAEKKPASSSASSPSKTRARSNCSSSSTKKKSPKATPTKSPKTPKASKETTPKAAKQSTPKTPKSTTSTRKKSATTSTTTTARKNDKGAAAATTTQQPPSLALAQDRRRRKNNNNNDGGDGNVLVSTTTPNNNNQTNEPNNKTKCRLVGGPLLGRRSSSSSFAPSPAENNSNSKSLPSSWRYHKPIITPEIDVSTSGSTTRKQHQRQQQKQRFILLPQQQNYITVLAYKTGTKVATLVIVVDDDEEQDGGKEEGTASTTSTTTTRIESVCLARNNKRHHRSSTSVKDALANIDHDDDEEKDGDEEVTNEKENQTIDGEDDDVLVMVGCHDGTIREFSLLELVRTMTMSTRSSSQSTAKKSSSVQCGGYELPGPFIRPRRIINVNSSTTTTNAAGSPAASVIHLAVPEIVYGSVGVGNDGLWMYCTMLQSRSTQKEDEDEVEDDVVNKSKQQNQNLPQYADVKVCRLIIPPFDGSTTVVDLVVQSEANHDSDGTRDDNLQITTTRESHLDELSPVTVMSKTECRIDSLPHLGSKITRTVPFEMVAVTRPTTTATTTATTTSTTQTQQHGLSVFVVVAKANSLMVYHELVMSSSSSTTRCRSFPSIEYQFDDRSQLTAIDVSLNKSDVTCGDRKGKIRIMNDLLVQVELHNIRQDKDRALQNEIAGDGALVESTNTSMDTSSLPPKVIVSKAHWHAHPVASLTYDVTSSPVDPLMYSGGDESVMVTWQTSHGRDRPADVLPRLALGGIVHLVMSSRDKSIDPRPASGVLVFCEDNSLQLIESHNKGRIWKSHGLAAMKTSTVRPASKSSKSTQIPKARPVRIQPDPRSNKQRRSQLVLTGLADAPGLMHWYDPTRERIVSKLEVAPFNRISRTEPDEKPLPSPCVTHHSFNGNGSDLITIDEAPTENSLVGSYEQRNGSEYGIVSTIRFWVWNDGPAPTRHSQKSARVPYRQIASMTYPHGPKNRVDALALSRDGLIACTVSNEEKAFRIWEKDVLPAVVGSTRDDEEEEDGPTETWTCRYKVAVPAGLSNFSTASGGVAFSDDGSILAVAFGRHVSLWDTDEAQLLTSFQDGSGTDIENIQFVNPGLHRDLLLIHCKKGVSMRSPYGENGSTASFQSWTWSVARDAKNLSVSTIVLVDSHDCVAISIYDDVNDRSQVITVESETGTPRDISSTTSYTVHETTGRVDCLTAVGRPNAKSNWDMKQQRHSPIFLYAMLSSAELILLHDLKDAAQTVSSQSTERRIQQHSMGPSLNIRTQQPMTGQKRRLNAVEMIRNRHSDRNAKRLALDIFGISASDELKNAGPTTNNLPSLSINFVRSFVGRNLSSNH